MSVKPKAERDKMWYALLQEIKTHLEDEGVTTRVTINASVDRNRLDIGAEIWSRVSGGAPKRLHSYHRDWPHGDALELSAACFQATVAVWKLYYEERPGEERKTL